MATRRVSHPGETIPSAHLGTLEDFPIYETEMETRLV